MNNILVDCNVYCDTLTLLLSDKTDLRAEVESQLNQSDYEIEQIGNELQEVVDEVVLSPKIMSAFWEASVEEIMAYITIDESRIAFDYDESENSGDRRNVAFRIPLVFNTDKYIQENVKERSRK